MALTYRTNAYPYYWGPVTAAENWCEEDYLISPYIAEYINTISCIFYVILGLRGLFRTWGSLYRSLPHLGLMLVGLCSGIFHASLREWPQLCDSLSMIVATAFVVNQLLTFDKPYERRNKATRGLIALVFLFANIHFWTNNLTLHSAVFACMLLFVYLRTSNLITGIKDGETQRKARRLALLGGLCALIGFIIWLTDVFVCTGLRRIRRKVGPSWGFLFEFHGWWHVLTAIAAHVFMMLVDDLTSRRSSLRDKIR